MTSFASRSVTYVITSLVQAATLFCPRCPQSPCPPRSRSLYLSPVLHRWQCVGTRGSSRIRAYCIRRWPTCDRGKRDWSALVADFASGGCSNLEGDSVESLAHLADRHARFRGRLSSRARSIPVRIFGGYRIIWMYAPGDNRNELIYHTGQSKT